METISALIILGELEGISMPSIVDPTIALVSFQQALSVMKLARSVAASTVSFLSF